MIKSSHSVLLRVGGLLIALIILCVVEVVIRLAVPGLAMEGDHLRILAEKAENRKFSVIKQPDPDLLWTLKPGSPLFTDERLNSLGFRGPAFTRDKAPGTKRIVILGDSRSFGFGVRDYGKTYAGRLNAFLEKTDALHHWEVINLSVIGYTSFQGAGLLKRMIDRVNPDILVIWFGFNDTLYYHVTDAEAAARSPALVKVSALLNRSYLVLGFRKLITRLTRNRHSPIPADQPIVRRVPPEDFVRNMKRMLTMAKSRHIPAVVLLSPVRPDIPMVLNSHVKSFTGDDGREYCKLVTQYDLDGFWLMDARTFPGTEEQLDHLLTTYPDIAILHYFKFQFLERKGETMDAKIQRDLAETLDVDRRTIGNYNRLAREVAERFPGAVPVDLPEAFRPFADQILFVDDCHPNENGHAIITREIVDVIRHGFNF